MSDKNLGKGKGASNSSGELSFIQKILSLFGGGNSDERIKQNKLKEINKSLGSSKYKFYNFKKELVTPEFGQFLYDIYKNSMPLKDPFNVKKGAGTIKNILLEVFSTKKQIELKNSLDIMTLEKKIRESKDRKKVIEDIKKTISAYISSFDSELVRQINQAYNLIMDLSNLINYDWYIMVHKFDQSITEGSSNYKPKFEAITDKYVSEDIISINDYLYSIDFNSDFKNIYTYLNSFSEGNGLSEYLKKLIAMFKGVKKDDNFLKLVKLVTKEPYFKPKIFKSDSKIVQEYLKGFQQEIQGNIQNVINIINKEKVNAILLDIFGTSNIIRLKNYTARLDDMITSRGLAESFKYIEPMNFLKAFLLDICKGEIKPRVDMLIIKGTWVTNEESTEYSELLESFNKITEKVLEFDNKCADDDIYGREVRKVMVVVKQDQKINVANRAVNMIDSAALDIIVESVSIFSNLVNKLNILLDDYTQKPPRIVTNFHKIKWEFPEEFDVEFNTYLKKTASFLTVMKVYAKDATK